MPRGPDRQWRRKKEPTTDHLIMASVERGMVDTGRGFYTEMRYAGIETRDRADELRKSFFRCAKRLGYSVTAQVEFVADGTFAIRYRAIDKAKARAWMIRTYGPDRSRWPYNPYARNPPSEAA